LIIYLTDNFFINTKCTECEKILVFDNKIIKIKCNEITSKKYILSQSESFWLLWKRM